jgi:ribosomal protein S18 acetylase RimI-like enzyme
MNAKTIIRRATQADIPFLTRADLLVGAEEDGVETPPELNDENAYRQHWAKIADFVSNAQKGAWIGQTEDGQPVGMILCRFRNRLTESFGDDEVFSQLDAGIFPKDGRFCEIFQLWVGPAYRRKGVARQLKIHLETESWRRGIEMIYTHMLATNQPVLTLNRQLGYTEVRRGPIWDDAIRVSLIKRRQRDIRYQAAIIQNGHVLLAQMRSPEGELFWLLPGGGREGNETAEECLIREMQEETGLTVKVERLLFVEPDMPGGAYDFLHTYLCYPISGAAQAGIEPEFV